ncbi:MAG: peptidase S8 [Candidatus Eremiobacteraeota bacterium]|nr:peptidase S8 [Candidatus Eremiobacteraeota bacterium]
MLSTTRSAQTDATPGESATGLPGESATGLPGESATGLPGESATGLPGATYACTLSQQPGSASCTIAINVNVQPQSDPNTPAASIPGWHPADLQSAYALPSTRPGQLVAIVDAYDNPNAEADLGVYRAAFGLPSCTTANGCFRKVNERGSSSQLPAANVGWGEEIALDLDMVSAACPNCSILLVETDSASLDDLGTGVDIAVALGARAVSNSYYAPEWSTERNEDAHYRHPGVPITASSGDTGAPSYPAASSSVVAVGGTTLSHNGAWNDVPWKYAGRGCSAYGARPAWQPDAGCSGKRATVDFSVVADPQTGVAMFDAEAGGWLVAGGTSVGAPLVAAAYALAGNGGSAALAYAHPTSFRDVPAGGFDLNVGLGALQGVGGL